MNGVPIKGRVTTCRSCLRMVIFDDANMTIHHEAPICQEFEETMSRAPGHSQPFLSLIHIPDELKGPQR